MPYGSRPLAHAREVVPARARYRGAIAYLSIGRRRLRAFSATAAGPGTRSPGKARAGSSRRDRIGAVVDLMGVRTVEVSYRNSVRNKVPGESLMLTDDANIVDVQFAIQYILKDPL